MKNVVRRVIGRPILSTRARRWAVGLPVTSDRPPAIFIHVPKSAGKSLIAGLGLEKHNSFHGAAQFFYPGHPVTFGHMSLLDLVRARVVPEWYLESAFVFTFVRNPYTRAVSLFRYLLEVRRLDDIVSPGFRKAAITTRPDSAVVFGEFMRFLESVAKGVTRIGAYNTFALSQANPQVRWTEGLRIDFVGSFENFMHDYRHVALRVTGEERDPVHDNASKLLGHLSSDDFLHEESRALIEHIYGEDFEAFGYAR